MKFFLDENIPLSVADSIKELGFEIEHARTSDLSGAPDIEIAKYARKQQAILVTKDLEFGSSFLYPKGSHHGLLIIRLPHKWKVEKVITSLKEFLLKVDPEKLVNAITVLEIGKYRIRRVV